MASQFLSMKNFSLTPAATDLGLGDQVQQQLEDELAKRKKLSSSIGMSLNPALGSTAMQSLGLSTINGTLGPV